MLAAAMERQPRRRDRGRRAVLTALAAGFAVLFAPSEASAATDTFSIPITVGGYAVKQTVVNGPRPQVDGHITNMEVDIVDDQGEPVPISRLMLHHIVFLNQGRPDGTCNPGIVGFDNIQTAPAVERFYAAGEERAKLAMPDGYGYDMGAPPAGGGFGGNRWSVLYMVMNHRSETDSAFIEYKVTYSEDTGGVDSKQDALPFWMDAENCRADPIYNIPGTGDEGATDVNVSDFTVDQNVLGATGGRIIAGAGHVHGGAYELEVSQPQCGDRTLADSLPTWGNPDHPFYNVKPILHEPGPINMTAFETEQGFPIRAGHPLRLSSVYDDTRPHSRVMGIMIVFIAPDSTVPADPCSAPMPDDVVIRGSEVEGRTGEPPEFKVPLTGLDQDGQAIKIAKPPGKTENVKSGTDIVVQNAAFSKRNVRIDRGDKLDWIFDTASSDLHNVTLANGPKAIGSPNLSRDGEGTPRTFSRRFNRSGTYRLFCALHPVQMSERVVVKP
jgi:plastocyanin